MQVSLFLLFIVFQLSVTQDFGFAPLNKTHNHKKKNVDYFDGSFGDFLYVNENPFESYFFPPIEALQTPNFLGQLPPQLPSQLPPQFPLFEASTLYARESTGDFPAPPINGEGPKKFGGLHTNSDKTITQNGFDNIQKISTTPINITDYEERIKEIWNQENITTVEGIEPITVNPKLDSV